MAQVNPRHVFKLMVLNVIFSSSCYLTVKAKYLSVSMCRSVELGCIQKGDFAQRYSSASWCAKNALGKWEPINVNGQRCLESVVNESAPTICRLSESLADDGKLFIKKLGSGKSKNGKGWHYNRIDLKCLAKKISSRSSSSSSSSSVSNHNNCENNDDFDTLIYEFDVTGIKDECCKSEVEKPEMSKELSLHPGEDLNLSCAASCPDMGSCEMSWLWTSEANKPQILASERRMWRTCECPPCKFTLNHSLRWNQTRDGLFDCRMRNPNCVDDVCPYRIYSSVHVRTKPNL